MEDGCFTIYRYGRLTFSRDHSGNAFCFFLTIYFHSWREQTSKGDELVEKQTNLNESTCDNWLQTHVPLKIISVFILVEKGSQVRERASFPTKKEEEI